MDGYNDGARPRAARRPLEREARAVAAAAAIRESQSPADGAPDEDDGVYWIFGRGTEPPRPPTWALPLSPKVRDVLIATRGAPGLPRLTRAAVSGMGERFWLGRLAAPSVRALGEAVGGFAQAQREATLAELLRRWLRGEDTPTLHEETSKVLASQQ